MATDLDELEGLAVLGRRLIVAPGFDSRQQPGFGSDHAAVLRDIDIDGAATVLEVVAIWGRVGAPRALAALKDLLAWGACSVTGEQKEPPVASMPMPSSTPAPQRAAMTHEALMAEPNELDVATRQRILLAATMLSEGRVFELLGVPKGTDRGTLKRAYYGLAKEFHPDRFFGKQLGSFARLLDLIFEAASQAVKTLLDQRTVTPQTSPTGKQRRRTQRFVYSAPVRMRCESWPEPLSLETRQIGAGGMFVATEQPAAIGERAALEVTLSDHGLLPLRGRIVERVQARAGRPAGLCLQLDPMSEADRARLAGLIQVARARQPLAAEQPAETSVSRMRLARGTGAVRTVAPIIGIDLGTSYVAVSATIGGRVYVLPWADGSRSMPSVVAFPQRGRVVVGTAARERLARDPQHAIASSKRLLGRKADDREIQGQLATSGYSTLAGPQGDLLLEMWGEPYAIPQICGYLLDAARVTAEKVLGQSVGTAVLTVPVSFGLDRVNLMKRAARLANLEVIDVIDEPSAAALANRGRPDFGGAIGVYDFGGGTFDFSVVDASGGDFRVVSTAGDSWLGGDDFDQVVADALANHYWKKNGVDLRQRAVEWQYLLQASERAKRELSTADEAQVVVPEVLRTSKGTSDMRTRIMRHQVEQLWQPLIDRSLATCLSTMALVGMQPSDLQAVYLSGGTTYIPAVRKALHTYFGIAPRTGVPPDFAVCLGAGIHAAQLEQLQEPTLPGR